MGGIQMEFRIFEWKNKETKRNFNGENGI